MCPASEVSGPIARLGDLGRLSFHTSLSIVHWYKHQDIPLLAQRTVPFQERDLRVLLISGYFLSASGCLRHKIHDKWL